jgi:ribosomal protein S18 acetylase RimI-like enzyme
MSQQFVTTDGRTGSIRPATEFDAEALIQAVDNVAREMTFFLRSRFEMDAEKERAFITQAHKNGNLILLATLEERLVAWLTMFRGQQEFRQHTAELGLGVIRGYRGLGIGTTLMEYARQWAAEQSLERINLGVRASNYRAQSLYRKFGFVQEGRRVREIKDTKGHYDDSIEMAYFVPASPSAQQGEP